MEAEHKQGPGTESNDKFIKPNNSPGESTSKEEWEFVVEPDTDKAYKERGGGFREEHGE